MPPYSNQHNPGSAYTQRCGKIAPPDAFLIHDSRQ